MPVDRIFYMAAGQGIFMKDTLYKSIGENSNLRRSSYNGKVSRTKLS